MKLKAYTSYKFFSQLLKINCHFFLKKSPQVLVPTVFIPQTFFPGRFPKTDEAPLGYFDPLGLSKDGDVDTFRRRRESELKNGRVAWAEFSKGDIG